MKCPHCSNDIKESLIVAEAARINGRRSKRSDGGGRRCPVHGNFLRPDGTCSRCEKKS